MWHWGSPRPKKIKIKKVKVMATIFFFCRGHVPVHRRIGKMIDVTILAQTVVHTNFIYFLVPNLRSLKRRKCLNYLEMIAT